MAWVITKIELKAIVGEPRIGPDGLTFQIWLPSFALSAATYTIAETGGNAVITINRTGSTAPVSVNFGALRPPAFARFQPECRSDDLRTCSRDEIVNAYDNTIRYTDHFLAQTVAWLKQRPQPSALVYVSDHGESLGENNLYLHGLPYALAPDEQKHVPMLTWVSPALRQARGWPRDCLAGAATQPPVVSRRSGSVCSATSL